MKSLILLAALLTPAVALAADKKAEPAAEAHLSPPAFELFRLVPGKTEDFIRGVAIWDQVNAAGGQPKTQVYFHEDGEGWDVMLYKPPRTPPTPAQIAAMDAKKKELGLVGGPMFFIQLREKVADHAHLVMTGPMLAEKWVAELEAQRAAYNAEYKGAKVPQ
jgi:hypothetical protein